MRNARLLIISAVIPAALLCLSSCAGSPHEPTEKYILVADNTKIPYWQLAVRGLNHATAEMKVKSELQGPDGHDPQGEHDAFKRAVAEKPSGILISVSDASLLGTDINAAIDQGIPVITIDADAPDSKRVFFVGTDNYNAGLLGGKLASKLLNGKGNVVIYTIPGQNNLKDRLQGYEAAFADHTDVKIMQTVDMNGNSDVAFDSAKKLLDSKAKVDAFICLEALACPAVADVVNRANMSSKVKIVAMDTDPGTIEWINKGVISATIAQKPFTMAYYGTKLLDDVHHHPAKPLSANWAENVYSPYPTFVDTGAFVVNKDNVASLSQQPPTSNQ
ncbi:MAG TPA: substrate-binding domain-containing protein [Bryobacteraceae bacterium]|nr:substrate-binding domain-containing protein [Bryobacteraceae bacterium]